MLPGLTLADWLVLPLSDGVLAGFTKITRWQIENRADVLDRPVISDIEADQGKAGHAILGGVVRVLRFDAFDRSRSFATTRWIRVVSSTFQIAVCPCLPAKFGDGRPRSIRRELLFLGAFDCDVFVKRVQRIALHHDVCCPTVGRDRETDLKLTTEIAALP